MINKFQRIHNSLQLLGIEIEEFENEEHEWMDKKLKIIDSLKNQGIDIVTYEDFDL